MKIYNRKSLKHYRRDLRKNQTPHETILWKKLKNKKLLGYKFYRQYSATNYILDFYCPKARLAIELDGSHHAEKDIREYDMIRTMHLESLNITVLRFWNNEVVNNLENVMRTIVMHLEKE
jgi:very-short-patch-repair endonuclease